MLPYKRADRVADLIRREVCDILQREVKDPRVQMVTITDVRVSGDLRHARIFFSNLGSEADHQRALVGLQSAARFFRGELGRRLELRVVPELTFEFDESFERAGRLAQLFSEMKKEG